MLAMQNMGAQWIDTNAAASYVGAGAIWLAEYQSEINDILRRTTTLSQRLVPAKMTGQPSRFHEWRGLPGNATFSNPQTLAYGGQVGPVRGENTVALKALVDSLNFGLFDTEVTNSQGQFSNLQGKDLEDLVSNFMLTHDQALITGAAATPQVLPGVGATLQYCGLDTQLLLPSGAGMASPNCLAGASVVDFLKKHVAQMCAIKKFNVRPTAIHLHPETINKIEEQEKANQRYMNVVEIQPGVTVSTIPTVAGVLQLIPNPFMSQATGAAANDSWTAYIVTEPNLEYHWLTDPNPRVFQLGTVSDLAQKFVVIKFGAPIAKNAEDPDNAGLPLAHRRVKIAKA